MVRATSRGRNCPVLATRTEHVDLLVAELTRRGLSPLVLHGAMSPAQRRTTLQRVADWDPATVHAPLLLAATVSYIGEGFDCPVLDMLFLCSLVSSEPIITQYVGRIVRDLPEKASVEVHDYADTSVAMLTRMHGKRFTA